MEWEFGGEVERCRKAKAAGVYEETCKTPYERNTDWRVEKRKRGVCGGARGYEGAGLKASLLFA